MEYYNNYKNISSSFTGGNYPNVYIIDVFGRGLDRTVSNTLLIERGSHGEKTIFTIKSIAKRLYNNKIFKSNIHRPVVPSDNNYPSVSVTDSLFSILLSNSLRVGDILIANVETELGDNNSIITDLFCKEILINLIELDVVVIVPTGNGNSIVNLSDIGDIIVVGSFDPQSLTSTSFSTKNRYGTGISCFAEGKITLTADIEFMDTSAATAQIAGFVMLMQKYAKSLKRYLFPSEVKRILNLNGDKRENIVVNLPRGTYNNCNIPTWATVRIAINQLLT